ncbi:MAG: GLPGLI family protein [Flavobacteriia bacterium]|jgi:GLPGLI family protein
MTFSKSLSLVVVIFITNFSFSQITAGKITYERKTNLMKKFTDERAKRWINESNKNVIDVFELYFNDSMTAFIPVEDPTKQGMMAMATNKNTVVQNLNSKTRLSVLNIWGDKAYVQDSMINRQWKITENKRKIGKYDCKKAIYQMNDTTRIYAWFCEEIIPSIGPETFRGLPGAILGLATEDGGVVYFAKKVEVMTPEFDKIVPKPGKKVYTDKEIRTKLQAEIGDKPWGKGIVEELFMW